MEKYIEFTMRKDDIEDTIKEKERALPEDNKIMVETKTDMNQLKNNIPNNVEK